MSTDQPLRSKPYREYQPNQKYTIDRDRSYLGDIACLELTLVKHNRNPALGDIGGERRRV